MTMTMMTTTIATTMTTTIATTISHGRHCRLGG
jgi:hypothetical protein